MIFDRLLRSKSPDKYHGRKRPSLGIGGSKSTAAWAKKRRFEKWLAHPCFAKFLWKLLLNDLHQHLAVAEALKHMQR